MFSKNFTNFLIIFSKILLESYVFLFKNSSSIQDIRNNYLHKAINTIQIFIFYNKIILSLHQTALQYIFNNAIL